MGGGGEGGETSRPVQTLVRLPSLRSRPLPRRHGPERAGCATEPFVWRGMDLPHDLHSSRSAPSGRHAGCASKVAMASSIASHGLRFRAKMATLGANPDESSITPRETVTNPGIAVLRPRIGLPQEGQNTRVTTLPASDDNVYSRTSPLSSKRSVGNIAPVE